MKTGAIVQSSYIPWKGYFDLIDSVDEFILYDDAQFTKRDWRSRNQIKGPGGLQWLSLPIEVKGKFEQKICEALIQDPKVFKKHWNALQSCYGKCPYFHNYSQRFKTLYLDHPPELLSDFNLLLIGQICQTLGIKTKITQSMDYSFDGESPTAKLVSLCQAAGFTKYVSGPAAQSYVEMDLFKKAGIEVQYFSYDNYPEYPQPFGDFVHNVSVLDVIFNTGPKAYEFIKQKNS